MIQNNAVEKPNVLDPHQLIRIEAVHRGFLYQHLYLANCLLRAGGADVTKIVVEGDEDVELQRSGERVYVQVKTRQASLKVGDVTDALKRFSAVRAEHAAGMRSGTARFVIASNAAPASRLAELITSPDWPKDVEVHWPTGPSVIEPALPHPPVQRPVQLRQDPRALAPVGLVLHM